MVPMNSGEQVIKSWDYAKVKGLILTKGKFTLTLTNKRLISVSETKNSFTRDEMAVSAIDGISTSYKKKGGLFRTLCGLILCCTIILIPIGINLIRKQAQLSVDLCTAAIDRDFVLANSLKASGFLGRLFKGKRRMLVDLNSAEEIAKQLPALVINVKNSYNQQ